MAEICLEKVRKSFGDVQVIRELDLTIRDGEFFTFVGPSGCGKSTLLHMLAGLETVSGGTISFDGVVVNELSPRERDVAMVFQSYALYPHMTVYDNMAFPLKMQKRGKEEIREQVERVAATLGLKELLHRKPRELSGGQRQRVALGRALIRRPRVFLMDEPLSNLDARLRIEMRAELKRLHQELKTTSIYVTHDQAEAMSLSDRVAVLSGGEILQCAPPAEVYARPANTFVAGFIGSPPMNFILATVSRSDPPEVDCNGVVLTPGIGTLPEQGRLTAGIRPEDMSVRERPVAGSVEVVVSLVEPAGSFNWIDFTWNGVAAKGVAPVAALFGAGERAYMSFPAGKVHLFDAATGRRL